LDLNVVEADDGSVQQWVVRATGLKCFSHWPPVEVVNVFNSTARPLVFGTE